MMSKVISFDVQMSRLIREMTDPRASGGSVYSRIISSDLDFSKVFNIKYECIFQESVHWSYYIVLWGMIKITTLRDLINDTDILVQIRTTRKHLEVCKIPNFPPMEIVFNRRFSFDFENQLEEEGDFYFGVGLWVNKKSESQSNKRFRDEIEDDHCFLGDADFKIEDLPLLSDTEEEVDLPGIDDYVFDDPQDFTTYHRLNKTYLD